MKASLQVSRSHYDGVASACTWAPGGEELVSFGDEEQAFKKVSSEDLSAETLVSSFDGFVTCMAWAPSANENQPSEAVAATCSDGSLRILNGVTGKEEKRVEAYKAGAAICVQWNLDGSAIVTGGEDGAVKLWSRVGMLRNTIATTRYPVYCVCWGRGDEVLFSSGQAITIEQRERKQVQWKAHDGSILAADWNPVNNLIVTGGEDRKYRVWDAFGRQLFQSNQLEQVVTCISWNATGSCFAVGSFDLLQICDETGWTQTRDDLKNVGSLLHLKWNLHGTTLGGVSASGAVLFARLINKSIEYDHRVITLRDSKQVEVHDTFEDETEILVFRNSVIDMSVAFGKLLVLCTTPQVHVYNVNKPASTAQIVDLTPSRSPLLKQSEKLFLAGWCIFSYDGRKICGPQIFNGINVNVLDGKAIDVNEKVLAVLENDRTALRLVDLGKQQPVMIKHKLPIVEVALCHFEHETVAFVDSNGELFLHWKGRRTFKLPASNVQSISTNDQADILVAFIDGGSKLKVWSFPHIVWTDADLLEEGSITIETPGMAAEQPEIRSFVGNKISARDSRGSILTYAISKYPAILHDLVVVNNKWDEAIRLCRFVEEKFLWALLAGLAIKLYHLDSAEVALAATDNVAKLNFILHLKNKASEKVRVAELKLFRKEFKEAEQILLQANPPFLYRAIKFNTRYFKWERAREIAGKDAELQRLVDLYEKRWQTQELLSDGEIAELKQLKFKFSERPEDEYNSEEEENRNNGEDDDDEEEEEQAQDRASEQKKK